MIDEKDKGAYQTLFIDCAAGFGEGRVHDPGILQQTEDQTFGCPQRR